MISSYILAFVGTMSGIGVPMFLEATTPTSATFLEELGSYLTSLIGWAGNVLTTVWDTPILRVICFMTIPLIGIGIIARLMRL